MVYGKRSVLALRQGFKTVNGKEACTTLNKRLGFLAHFENVQFQNRKR